MFSVNCDGKLKELHPSAATVSTNKAKFSAELLCTIARPPHPGSRTVRLGCPALLSSPWPGLLLLLAAALLATLATWARRRWRLQAGATVEEEVEPISIIKI